MIGARRNLHVNDNMSDDQCYGGKGILRNRDRQRERSFGIDSREASPSFFDKLIVQFKDEFLNDGPSKGRARGGIPRNNTFSLPSEQTSP